MLRLLFVLVAAAMIAGCGSSAPTPRPTPTPEPTTEYKLAAIHGDLGAEAEFGRILDRIQAGGDKCDPERNRERVGDVIYASWEEAGKPDTLLEWARVLASVCE